MMLKCASVSDRLILCLPGCVSVHQVRSWGFGVQEVMTSRKTDVVTVSSLVAGMSVFPVVKKKPSEATVFFSGTFDRKPFCVCVNIYFPNIHIYLTKNVWNRWMIKHLLNCHNHTHTCVHLETKTYIFHCIWNRFGTFLDTFLGCSGLEILTSTFTQIWSYCILPRADLLWSVVYDSQGIFFVKIKKIIKKMLASAIQLIFMTKQAVYIKNTYKQLNFL